MRRSAVPLSSSTHCDAGTMAGSWFVSKTFEVFIEDMLRAPACVAASSQRLVQQFESAEVRLLRSPHIL